MCEYCRLTVRQAKLIADYALQLCGRSYISINLQSDCFVSLDLYEQGHSIVLSGSDTLITTILRQVLCLLAVSILERFAKPCCGHNLRTNHLFY